MRLSCGATDESWRVLTKPELLTFMQKVFAHEAGHGVALNHDLRTCTDSVMWAADNVDGMISYGGKIQALPIPTGYTIEDRARMRLHANQ